MVVDGAPVYGEWYCMAIWRIVVYIYVVSGRVRIYGEWW